MVHTVDRRCEFSRDVSPGLIFIICSEFYTGYLHINKFDLVSLQYALYDADGEETHCELGVTDDKP